MSYYANTPAPPKRDAVVAAARALLEAHAPLQAAAALGASGRIYERRPSSPAHQLLVVRERRELGGIPQSLSRRSVVTIQVMAESPDDPDAFFQDYALVKGWHHFIHDLVFDALQGQDLTLTGASQVLPLERITEPQTHYDAQKETHYSTTEYRAVIK